MVRGMGGGGGFGLAQEMRNKESIRSSPSTTYLR